MNKRIGILGVMLGGAALAYACGGTSTTGDDSGADSGNNDSTTGNDSGNDTGNDTGGNDTGTGDGGTCDACSTYTTTSCDAGCGVGTICVTKNAGSSTTSGCYPLPTCGGGCGTKSDCECVGKCVCPGPQVTCQNVDGGGIRCLGGTVSRREFKTDIDYVSDSERASLADQALHTRLAEYRYKTEAEGTQRHLGFIIDDMPAQSPAVEGDQTHVDLYGYSSMLLATVQEQQKQIDELKKQVDALKKKPR